MLIALLIFAYGYFSSGFAASLLFPTWLGLCYEAIFALPFIAYGALETQFEKESFLKFALLYTDGPEKMHFNKQIFAQWVIFTII